MLGGGKESPKIDPLLYHEDVAFVSDSFGSNLSFGGFSCSCLSSALLCRTTSSWI